MTQSHFKIRGQNFWRRLGPAGHREGSSGNQKRLNLAAGDRKIGNRRAEQGGEKTKKRGKGQQRKKCLSVGDLHA